MSIVNDAAQLPSYEMSAVRLRGSENARTQDWEYRSQRFQKTKFCTEVKVAEHLVIWNYMINSLFSVEMDLCMRLT